MPTSPPPPAWPPGSRTTRRSPPDKLRQIDAAETALRGLGFTDLRVRHHGDTARVELAADEIPRALREPLREQVIAAVPGADSPTVTIDPGGIRSGAFTLAVLQNGRDMTERSEAQQAAAECTPRLWPVADWLAGLAELDLDRAARRGYPEAVLCEGKTAEQVARIAAALAR